MTDRIIDGVTPGRIETPADADQVADIVREADASGGWVLLVGVLWIIAMTYICYRGIELSARFQRVLLSIEVVMLMVMFSMAGVPPFIGFYAKLVVLGAVLDAGLVWLAAVGMLFAVIGAFYYLRVVWYMYFADATDKTPLTAAIDMRVVISANALGLLVLGLFPGALIDLCARVLGT